MTPFEIRLELLKMAKEMLSEDYYGQRDKIANEWQWQMESAKHLPPEKRPKHPNYPPFPSEDEIIKKAKVLNDFVSQTN